MNPRSYVKWTTKIIQGIRLLFMTDYTGNVDIWDDNMSYYGSWVDQANFEKKFRAGEVSILDVGRGF